jgi:hypothetical protein
MAPVERLTEKLLRLVYGSEELAPNALPLLINMTFQATSAVDAILSVNGAIQMLADLISYAEAEVVKDIFMLLKNIAIDRVEARDLLLELGVLLKVLGRLSYEAVWYEYIHDALSLIHVLLAYKPIPSPDYT